MRDIKKRKRLHLMQAIIVLFSDVVFLWIGLKLLQYGEVSMAIAVFFTAVIPFTYIFYKRYKQYVFDGLSITAPVFTSSANIFYTTIQAGSSDDEYYTEPKYYASFELSSRSIKTFRVEFQDFNSLKKGDVGILTYKEQGKFLQFVSFKKQIDRWSI